MSRLANIVRSLLLCLLLYSGLLFANGLPEPVRLALQTAGIPESSVSVFVQALDGSSPLWSLNAEQAHNPASVMKLVTTYVALETLGPSHTWKTRVWADGEIHDGKLSGNLVIKGGGDPYLTLERMWLMLRALRMKGIREIDGDLVLDTSRYDLPPMDPGAFDGEPLAAYNAVPGPLVANFNAQEIHLVPENDGVSIQPTLALPDMHFVSKLQVVLGSCNGWRGPIEASLTDAASNTFTLEGPYPASCGDKTLNLNLLDSARNFAQTFRALWEETGGVWLGKARQGTAPAERAALLEFESPPLEDLIRPMNKYSSNVMARMLYLDLGVDQAGEPGTLAKSEQVLRGWLKSKGLEMTSLVVDNGSGLSRQTRVSAEDMGRLLIAAGHSAYFSEFESALPIAALDGTMKSRMNSGGVAGNAHLKTGTLRGSKAMAGYVRDRNGRVVVVVCMIEHPNAERGALAQDALAEWIYQGAIP